MELSAITPKFVSNCVIYKMCLLLCPHFARSESGGNSPIGGSPSGNSPKGAELERAKSAETGSKLGSFGGAPWRVGGRDRKINPRRRISHLLVTIWRKNHIDISYQFSGGLCTSHVHLCIYQSTENVWHGWQEEGRV